MNMFQSWLHEHSATSGFQSSVIKRIDVMNSEIFKWGVTFTSEISVLLEYSNFLAEMYRNNISKSLFYESSPIKKYEQYDIKKK